MKVLIKSSQSQAEKGISALQSGHNFPPTPITCREQEIVSSIAYGLSNKEVANQFGLSESTIKQHLSNIFKKLGARNRVEATRIASECGMLLH